MVTPIIRLIKSRALENNSQSTTNQTPDTPLADGTLLQRPGRDILKHIKGFMTPLAFIFICWHRTSIILNAALAATSAPLAPSGHLHGDVATKIIQKNNLVIIIIEFMNKFNSLIIDLAAATAWLE